jgi:hypothetical protein
MATSGATGGLMTAGEVVRTAYEIRGAVGIEADVTGSQMDFGIKQLNWMLKGWQSDGKDCWRLKDITIDWTADTPEAELDDNVLDVVNLRFEDRRPLERWSREEVSAGIVDKAQGGEPVIYCPWRERDRLWLRLWPVPTSAATIRADVLRIAEDVTSPGETLDIQQEWTEAVIYNLSTRLVGGDPKLVPIVEQRAGELYRRLPQFDLSGSLFLQPA